VEPVDVVSPFFDIIAVLLGLIVGSFLNVCIHRLPKDQSIVRPRSRCPSCQAGIPWYDNVPVLSYLVLRGRCRSCGVRISIRYPLVEILTALIAWVIFRQVGVSWLFLVWFGYAAALLTLSVIDLDHRIIPDGISLSGIVIGLVLSAVTPLQPFLDSLIGVLIGGGFLLGVGMAYEAVRKQEGIGGGDIKLMAMVGAFTGWQGALFTIFGGSLVASVFGITVMIVRRSGAQVAIPFGPFLSVAAFCYVLWGEQLIHLYLGTLQP
jgi:leader peptidase (prepilin peptidase) / N-methyltransferase